MTKQVAETNKKPSAAADKTRIEVNIHRLGGDEIGYEVSTRKLKNKRGLYFVESAGDSESALRQLADAIYEDGNESVPDVIYRSLVVIHDERSSTDKIAHTPPPWKADNATLNAIAVALLLASLSARIMIAIANRMDE